MYNSDVKQRFIEQYTDNKSNRQNCMYFFKKTKKYEEEAKKDISAFTIEEAADMLSEIISLKSNGQGNLLTVMRAYCRWCLENGVPDSCDSLLNIDPESLKHNAVITQMVANPVHLQSCLDEIFSSEDIGTQDDTYRAFMWFAYADMDMDDIFCLTKDNIDLVNMEVVYNGRSYRLEELSKKSIVSCMNNTHFLYTHANYTKDWERVPGEQLLRGVKSEMTYTLLKKRFREVRYNKDKTLKTKMRLTYNHVRLSGNFYRLRLREVQGFTPNFYEITHEKLKDKEYKLDKTTIKKDTILKRIASADEIDYKKWKEAYPV